MTAEAIPILVFRSARPGASFEARLFSHLTPPRRRALVAGISVLLPLKSSMLRALGLGRRHGPSLVELRLRFEDPATRTYSPQRSSRLRGRTVVLSAFFTDNHDALILLSCGVTAGERNPRLGTPGLGEAHWRLRELSAADGDASCTLVLYGSGPIVRQLPQARTSPARMGGTAPRAPERGLRDFRHLHEDVRREAAAEGPDAMRELAACEDRFTLASVVLRRRQALGQTQTQIARASDIPQSEISRIEGGLANPALSTLGALARALDVELRIGRPGRHTA